MSKSNSKVNCVFYGFIGVLLAFAAVCLVMAIAGVLTRPVYASEMKTEQYEVLYKLPKEEVKITKEVCDTVTQSAAWIKGMINKGYDDDAISEKLSEAALANLGDRNGWIAYYMLVDPKALANMREWPTEASYQWMQQKYPTMNGGEYYQVYAGGKCDQLIGKIVKVHQVKKLDD
jgi:hypothetical protein